MNSASEDSLKQEHAQALTLLNSGKLCRMNGFVSIPTAVFIDRIDVGGTPDIPAVAFYLLDPQGEPTLLRKENQRFSALALTAHESLWIRDVDLPKIRAYAERLLLNPSVTATLPPERRMECLRQSAILIVDDIFQNPTPENMARGMKIVSSFVHVLMKDPKSYLLLAQLSSHDPYTLQHSVGTAVNCIILGRKLGLNDEQSLLDAGLSGLLHDVGKTKVKKEIINKEGPLDEDEWEEMRMHSSEGFKIAKSAKIINERVTEAILHHHEDNTGTGYPHKLKAADLDIFPRIVAICDVFNALTTNRSYSKARTPFEALVLMREKLMGKLDERLFKEMVLIYGGKI